MFQRSWTRAAVVLALAVSSLSELGCRPETPGEAREVLPELKLEGVRFRVHREGDLRASGHAAAVSLRRDSTEVAARDVEAVLLRGGAPVRIAAPAAEGVMATRVFSASGGLTVTRGDDVARTERARFVPGPGGGRVYGDDPVVIEGRSYRLVGTGFTLEPAAAELSMRGGARLVAGGGERR